MNIRSNRIITIRHALEALEFEKDDAKQRNLLQIILGEVEELIRADGREQIAKHKGQTIIWDL
jgi:hypothetical protein